MSGLGDQWGHKIIYAHGQPYTKQTLDINKMDKQIYIHGVRVLKAVRYYMHMVCLIYTVSALGDQDEALIQNGHLAIYIRWS